MDTYDLIIVGSGLSGLSAAHFLNKSVDSVRYLILESDARPGGAVKSFSQDGFHGEWGPHGFLDNTSESKELLADLGLDRVAMRAPLGNFVRFVCHNGRLQQLPQSPGKLLTTPLLSVVGKLRLLGDLWRPVVGEDQTVGQWAAHRFGPEVLPLVDAAVTGTFAGDYNRLSIDAVMPGVRDLEKKYGSVLKGLRNKKQSSRADNGATPHSLPAMLNFPQGMEQLITALAQGKPVRYGTRIESIRRAGDEWRLQAAGEEFSCRQLLLGLPVNAALKLLAPLSSPPVDHIRVARIINIVMGFDGAAEIPRGFGYLSPERENRFALGAMFTTHMFPGRAPQGHVMLEALVGGVRHPEKLKISDEDLVAQTYDDLRQLLPLPHPPCFVKVLRPESGIPQMEMSHPSLLQWRQEIERNYPLLISGFGWDGIGMNEMIKSAKSAAAIIAGTLAGRDGAREVKPVYF